MVRILGGKRKIKDHEKKALHKSKKVMVPFTYASV